MFNNIYVGLKKFIKENFGVLIVIAIFLVVWKVKIPYQVEMPGGTIDLANRVVVNGEEPVIKGSFNMAYVSVAQGSIMHTLVALVLPDWEIVKQSDVMYENETVEEANERERLYLKQSINYATVTAMDAAGIDYDISNKINYVVYVSEKANTTLKVGDNIIACEGENINEIERVSKIINTKSKGDTVTFKVLRNGKEATETAIVYEEEGKMYAGFSALTLFDIASDTDVRIDSKATESGPSGGMMMALMTYNALTNQDLTHGKKIVGTGTIELDGTVGEIGGVKFKLMGAVKNDADIFLVPKDNYEEAMKVKEDKNYDIEIVSIEKLEDAINYLEGLDS